MFRKIQLDIEKADRYQAKEIYLMLLQQVYQKQNAVKHLMVGSPTLFIGLTEHQIDELESLAKSVTKDEGHYIGRVNECLDLLKELEQNLTSLTARMLKINPVS
jgi:hypothetical protein